MECTSKINYAFYNVLRVLCFDVIFYFPAAVFIHIILYTVTGCVPAITHTRTGVCNYCDSCPLNDNNN